METAELLKVLAQDYPNGVSFDPMALRLLRQKVPFEDWQIEDLKSEMFQQEDGLWFSCNMISSDESQLVIRAQAIKWLSEYGCFSVERLFNCFFSLLHHYLTLELFTAFLRYLGFSLTAWGKSGLFCFQSPSSLDEHLEAISKKIAEQLEEADGTLALNKIEEALPYLNFEALESIRVKFLPEVHMAEVGGVPCWRSTEAISLPEDFAEKLTIAIDTLVARKEKVSSAKLEFALDLFYRIRFREEYALLDDDTFMNICAKNYQGGNDAFPNIKKLCERATDWSVPGKRVRSPNTRFHSLGVPIGAELFFKKDSQITCIVLDDSNQVEYSGKAWAISALAMYLLGVPVANGFANFSYAGEILWDRRLRLERGGIGRISDGGDAAY